MPVRSNSTAVPECLHLLATKALPERLKPDGSSALPGCSCPNGQICELKLDELGGRASALVSTVLPPCAKLTASRSHAVGSELGGHVGAHDLRELGGHVGALEPAGSTSIDSPDRIVGPKQCNGPARQVSACLRACLRAGVYACQWVCVRAHVLHSCSLVCVPACLRTCEWMVRACVLACLQACVQVACGLACMVAYVLLCVLAWALAFVLSCLRASLLACLHDCADAHLHFLFLLTKMIPFHL